MTTITLTPARVAVLKAVGDGEVKHHRNGHDPEEDVWRPGGYRHKKVSATIEYLRKAGLVRLGPATSASIYAPKVWQLTDAGERWLAENDGRA